MLYKFLSLVYLTLAQTRDCQIALDAWNEMGGNPSYSPSASNCCGDTGISCSSNRIVSISWSGPYFSNKQMISSKLANLELYLLILSGFSLQTIPQFVYSLRNISYLSITRCELSGAIPSEIGNLAKLQTL